MQTDALHTAFDNFLIYISLQLFHVKSLRAKNLLLQINASLNRLMTLWEAMGDQVSDYCNLTTIRSEDAVD